MFNIQVFNILELHEIMIESLIEVITKYITSEDFMENKKFDILNNSII